MRKLLLGLGVAALAALPASAALPVGAEAPDIVTTGAMGGEAFRLHLASELKKGPVVLYFYPKAFSEARDSFREAGAQVIGMSGDDLATLKRFSVEACRSAFPVATASPQTIAAYDVALKGRPTMSNRTSYVIAPDGRIAFVHSDMDWSEHVSKTLAAVQALRR